MPVQQLASPHYMQLPAHVSKMVHDVLSPGGPAIHMGDPKWTQTAEMDPVGSGLTERDYLEC